MKKAVLIFIALAVVLWVVLSTPKPSARPVTGPSLTVFCAAGLKKPVEAIAEQYRQEFGVDIHLQYGPTGTLLSNIRVAQRGDLFLAADDGSVTDAKKYDVIREVIPLVRQHPIIAVRKGNPKNIHAIADLVRDDVKVILPNPKAASIARVSAAALGTTWDKLAEHATVMKPSVTEVAADLALGTVDAGIIWDATAPQFPGLEIIEVPELTSHSENSSAAVLTFCTQPTEALRFARYLAAPEKGGQTFNKQGFKLAGGDAWVLKPELVLYSGSVNRPAVEKLLKGFSDREGATITTVFNGCGILCATMKTMGGTSNPRFPDAYYACDICFVPPVADVFPEAVLLTETDIGIVVKKGNPRGIKSLADLAQPGLRVGLSNAEQATLGYMTRGILKSSGFYDAIRTNVVVEVPTADFLINQMRVGGLDAAIVYRVNAQLQSESLEFIPIQHPGAKAMQPFAVRNTSPRRQLSGRLLAYLQAHRHEFEAAGFTWHGDQGVVKSKDIQVPDWLKEK